MSREDKQKISEDLDQDSKRSRPGSRRNSTPSSVSRRNSLNKESTERLRRPTQQTPPHNRSTPGSSQSTPKKHPQKFESPQQLELLVTGKQILKKSNRANSLPVSRHRRQSLESSNSRSKTKQFAAKTSNSNSSRSRETSLEDDMSLDLSQVSDFEDASSKYGVSAKIGMMTSTPKSLAKIYQKPRSGSLQCQKSKVPEQPRGLERSFDSSRYDSAINSSVSLYKTSSITGSYHDRYGRSTELDYSSVSPGGYSSSDLSPRTSVLNSDAAVVSPFSAPSQISGASCYLSWAESSDDKTKIATKFTDNGEWNNFWVNYNNSMSRVPIKNYYDQCPTPYRTENIELTDLDINADDPNQKAPDLNKLNDIIRNEGLTLTPRETQNIIKCAHILGNVLSKAIDRKVKEKDVTDTKVEELDADEKVGEDNAEVNEANDKEEKKRNLILELAEQNKPLEVEVISKESATTQTDISLPNTKSAPRIFENILRQLSRTSLDDGAGVDKKKEDEKKEKAEDKTVEDNRL